MADLISRFAGVVCAAAATYYAFNQDPQNTALYLIASAAFLILAEVRK